MLDSTPESLVKEWGCLIKVGRFFILTTFMGLVLSVWEWFNGRILALTIISFFCFLIIYVLTYLVISDIENLSNQTKSRQWK